MLKVFRQQTNRRLLPRLVPPLGSRSFASETESAIEQKLQNALAVKEVDVRDTSGGCGTMFEINIIAEEFQNKSIVQQHKVVTKVLKEDIAQWHGFTLVTSAPSES